MAFVFNRDMDNHGATTTSTAESANSNALVLAGLAAQCSRARLTTFPRARTSLNNRCRAHNSSDNRDLQVRPLSR
jgi:uncharacterized protein (UPF0333 family)